MLSLADADLARRDSGIPGLSLVLDPEALLATLRSRFPQADLRTAEITDVKYRPGHKCLVGYQLDVAGSTVELYAKSHRTNARDGHSEVLGVPGPLGAGQILLDDCAVLISFFPNDNKLRGLSGFADSDSQRDLLREILRDRPDLWDGSVRSIRWRPERRYIAQLVTGDQVRAALKFCTASRYAVNRAHAETFTSRRLLTVARLIAHSHQHSVLVFEWLPGPTLGVIYGNVDLDFELVADVGRALAELHAQTPKGLRSATPQAELDALHSMGAWLGAVCPPVAAIIDKLIRRLAPHLMDTPRVNASIHGDFNPRQVLLLSDGKIGMVDFDDPARGDPCADLGEFIAHVERDALHGDLVPSRARQIEDALVAGYRSVTNEPSPARIELYTAVRLLLMAPHPFKFREPDWAERTETIIERAASILDRFERRRGRNIGQSTSFNDGALLRPTR